MNKTIEITDNEIEPIDPAMNPFLQDQQEYGDGMINKIPTASIKKIIPGTKQ